MAAETLQATKAWRLARSQHWVISARQLHAIGFGEAAIRHRLENGRLSRLYRGVYAVGRPDLTRHGAWMAAVLAAGWDAALSHRSAAELLELIDTPRSRHVSVPVHVAVPASRSCEVPGVRAHRRTPRLLAERPTRERIPHTPVALTFADCATRMEEETLEAMVSAADRRDLIDPETLRRRLELLRGQPGVAKLRRVLDRRTFRLTDSELERRFIPVAVSAGMAVPLTGVRVNGFKVDFHWPELGLVVETDGLRYHRTPSQQARDRLRDQTHAAAGLTTLRFTHWQVVHRPAHVRSVLASVAARLRRSND